MSNKPVPKSLKREMFGLITIIVTGVILFPLDYNSAVRASNTQENSHKHSENRTIIPGVRVGVYELGMSKEEVLKRLGKTKENFLHETGDSINVDGLILNITFIFFIPKR
ncbi:MAG: hypothetical protein ACYTE8_04475 [Planctomycetota bacterium]